MHFRKSNSINLMFVCYVSFFLLSIFACKGKTPDADRTDGENNDTTSTSAVTASQKNGYIDTLLLRKKQRMSFYDSMTKNSVVAPYKNDPIDKPIGDVYIKSYLDRMKVHKEDNTRAVMFSKQQLQMYIDFLNLMGKDSLMMAFGRYDKDLLSHGNLFDYQFHRVNYKPDTRFTLIVGVPEPLATRTKERYILPFKIGQSEFYDDWQGLWP